MAISKHKATKEDRSANGLALRLRPQAVSLQRRVSRRLLHYAYRRASLAATSMSDRCAAPTVSAGSFTVCLKRSGTGALFSITASPRLEESLNQLLIATGP